MHSVNWEWNDEDMVHNIPLQTTVKRVICCLIFNVVCHHFKLIWRALRLPPPVTGSWAAARAALLFGTARVPAPELPRYQAWHLFPRYTVSPRRIFGGCRNFDIDAVMNTQYSGSNQCKKCLLIVEMNHQWTLKLNESLNFQSLMDLFRCEASL